MFPLFGSDSARPRREINLGGASSVASQSALIEQARVRRSQREADRRREESALQVQGWWRGLTQARDVRKLMRATFEADVTGLKGLRCLVLTRDEEALALWSSAVVASGDGAVLLPLNGPEAHSWLVLLSQVSVLLLKSVAKAPEDKSSLQHLRVLSTLLSTSAAVRVLGSQGPEATVKITRYLLAHGLYTSLRAAVLNVPVQSKNAACLPLLVPLLTAPLATLSTVSSTSPTHDAALYATAMVDLTTCILTIPLLPYRVPIESLPRLSAQLPLSSLQLLSPSITTLVASLEGPPGTPTGAENKIHLLANLLTFTPARYAKLPAPAWAAYLRLLAALMNALPANALAPPAQASPASALSWATGTDSDDEDGGDENENEHVTQVRVVSSFAAPIKSRTLLLMLDERTLKRLDTLPSAAHLSAVLGATHSQGSVRPALFEFLMALCTVWPTKRDKVLGAVLANTGGAVARELYRGWVRTSPLGKDVSLSAVLDPANAEHWPPLLLLVDLYTQSLLTMGDDEFFSTSAQPAARASFTLSSTSSAATNQTGTPRNPLTLDELTSFSRQLLNIAFALYWREDQAAGGVAAGESSVPGLGVAMKWDEVRERLTRCLQAIHARDSRKPFTPPGHWLVTSDIDVQPFVEAALFEAQQLSEDKGLAARQLTKRQIAALSPRLGVLNNIPFAIPFDVRVSVFRGWVARDMIERSGDSASGGWTQPDRMARMMRGGRPRTRAVVRRGRIAEDGFDKLADADLKAPIEITFVDQFGTEEAGIDGGGVFKEFFTSLCKEVFDTDRGLWLATKNNELYPNPHSYAKEAHSLNWYRFIGRILGKALYEGILVDVAFASFFLAKWLGKQSFLDDLASLDPELYQGLIFLKHFTGNPEDLSLNFTIAEEEWGIAKTVDLIPNGSNTAVTRENKLQYIYMVSHYRLSKQIRKQSEAFFEGLSDIVEPKWLRMFNQQELQIMLGGVDTPVDLDDLRKHTNYGGLYDDEHETIVLFWKVANSFNHDQRRLLLRFVTSASRPPLLGFKELVPNFAIRDAGGDELRLPTSSTCVNLLKLPRYQSERVLREKVLQAINANAGFDLS